MAVVGYEKYDVGKILGIEEISAELTDLIKHTIEELLKRPDLIEKFKTNAETIYLGLPYSPGGYIQTLPGWSEFIKEAKDDWKKSYFISAIDILAGIAWDTWHQKGAPATYDRFKASMRKFWDEKDYDGLLKELKPITPRLYEVPAPTLPEVPIIKPKEARFLGIPINIWTILGAGVLGFFAYNFFFRKR